MFLTAIIDFFIIAKYNFPDYPLYEGATAQSDGNTTVVRQSFGATCAEYGKSFPADYQQQKYQETNMISPDGMIDASTCLFPYNTWFIKGLFHSCCLRWLDILGDYTKLPFAGVGIRKWQRLWVSPNS